MEAVTRWMLRHPKKIILVFCLVTLFFGLEMRNLRVNPAVEVFVPADHPEVVFYLDMREMFSLFSFFMVGVVDDREGGVFQPDTLELVKDLSQSFEDIEAVTGVVSLYEFPYIEGDPEGMTVAPLYSDISTDPAWLRSIEDKIQRWPLLVGNMVSRDGRATALLVRYGSDIREATRKEIYHELMKTIEATPSTHQEVFVSGMTAIEVCISEAIVKDLKRLIPVVYLVVILCLWLSFRRLLGVLLPLLTVIISTLWAMGLMALLDIPLNPLSGNMPVLLTAVGTAYTIHILFHFLHNAHRSPDREEAFVRAVSQVGYAVVMAGLTTMGGFASLGVSEVVPIKQYGLFSAFGTGVALLCSVTLIPAILAVSMGRIKIGMVPESRSKRGGLGRFLRWYVRNVIRHRRTVYVLSCLFGIVCLVGTMRIYPESDYITQFKESTYIRKSDKMINEHFSGSSVLNIIVDGGNADGLKDPDLLKRIESLQRHVESLPHVGGTTSLVDYLKRMNQALHGDDPGFYRVPDTRELVAQSLLLYSMSGDESDLEDVINDDYSQGCISVFLKSGSTRYAGKLIQNVETYNDENTRLSIHMTAAAVIGKLIDDMTIQGQIESIITSTIVVFCLVTLILRSFIGGLFGILPLMLCVFINFGILGLAGIPLQTGTALIGSVALGIGIDYAIHFLNMARIKGKEEEGIRRALEATASTAGRAILYNATAVGLGFLALVLCSFIPQIYFGAFITLTMITASVATLTLLPCLIYSFRPRFLEKVSKNTDLPSSPRT
jgi:predicted RND superfamily exporter protein